MAKKVKKKYTIRSAEMSDLTPRQKKVLEFVQLFIRHKSESPSVREIADGMKSCSLSRIASYLEGLEKRGYIYRTPGKPRSIVLANQKSQLRFHPVTWFVENGKIQKSEQPLAPFAFPSEVRLNLRGCFLIRVIDDSMKDCSIHSGDCLVVRRKCRRLADRTILFMEDESNHLFIADYFKRQEPNGKCEGIIVPRKENSKCPTAFESIHSVFVMTIRPTIGGKI